MDPVQENMFEYKDRLKHQHDLEDLFDILGSEITSEIKKYTIKDYDNSSHDGKFIPKDWPEENTIVIARQRFNQNSKWDGWVFAKDPENNEVISMIGDRPYAPEETLFTYLDCCSIQFNANKYRSKPGKERVYVIPVENSETQESINIVILQKEDREQSETIVFNLAENKAFHFQSSVINLPDFIVRNKDIDTINSYNTEEFKIPGTNTTDEIELEEDEEQSYNYVKEGKYRLPNGEII